MNTFRNITIAVLLIALSTVGFYYLGYTQFMNDFSGNMIKSEFTRLEKLAEGTNRLVHLPKATQSNSGLRTSPDVLYSYINYDLSEGPLGVHIPLPQSVWSINFYDVTGKNYYSLDNRRVTTNDLQLIISTEELAIERKEGLKKVVALSPKGIAIIRYVMTTPEMENELVELRKSMQSSLVNLKKQGS